MGGPQAPFVQLLARATVRSSWGCVPGPAVAVLLWVGVVRVLRAGARVYPSRSSWSWSRRCLN